MSCCCLLADEFESSTGCGDVSASPGQAAEALRHGLWAAWDMFSRWGWCKGPGGGGSMKGSFGCMGRKAAEAAAPAQAAGVSDIAVALST